jgi:diguanylate cyclase (GGDEF)-like protein
MYGRLPVGVAVWDGSGVLVYANPAALKLLGHGLDRARGMDARALIGASWPAGATGGSAPEGPALDPAADRALQGTTHDGRDLTIVGTRLESPDTGGWWISNVLETPTDAGAAQLSLHDDLTGLPNRRLLIDRLEYLLRAAQREDASSALCLLKLVHLEDARSMEGVAGNNGMLQAAAAAIAGTLRNVDTVARFADDRFAVLLPSTNEVGAVTAVVRMREALDQRFEHGSFQGDLSVYAGIVLSPFHASDASALIAFAETALAAAESEDSRCVVYDAGLEGVRPE